MKYFKCFIGVHKYDIYKEIDLNNDFQQIIVKCIISKCEFCGKIKFNTIRLSINNY